MNWPFFYNEEDPGDGIMNCIEFKDHVPLLCRLRYQRFLSLLQPLERAQKEAAAYTPWPHSS